MAEPLLDGAVHETPSVALPFVTFTSAGASGAVALGVPVAVPDQAPPPTRLTACTRSVYCVAFVRSTMRRRVCAAWNCRAVEKSSLPDFHCTR